MLGSLAETHGKVTKVLHAGLELHIVFSVGVPGVQAREAPGESAEFADNSKAGQQGDLAARGDDRAGSAYVQHPDLLRREGLRQRRRLRGGRIHLWRVLSVLGPYANDSRVSTMEPLCKNKLLIEYKSNPTVPS